MTEIKEIISKIWQPLLIAGLVLICIQNCNDKDIAVSDLEKSKDSNNELASKYLKKYYESEKTLTDFKDSLSKLKPIVIEKIVYLTKIQKETKPFVKSNTIDSCNENYKQAVYYSLHKDSVANGVINDLTGICIQSDSIISLQDKQKKVLLNSLLFKSNENNDLEKINLSNKDLIRKKSNQNLFWKSITGLALAEILRNLLK